MLHGLHSFGNHLAAEGGRQANHAHQDGQIIGINQHVAHKALIDLEQGDGQEFQVSQRGIPGAEIVQSKRHMHFAASFDDLRYAGHVLQRAGFQHLKLELIRPDARMRRQQFSQAQNEAGVLQLTSTDIDTHRNVQPGCSPHFDLRQRGIDHPFANINGQRMVFNHRQKHRRRQEPLFRMLPANQRLGTDDLA